MRNVIERIRDKGVTLTPQRMAVVEFLSQSKKYPTAGEIHKNIQKRYPSISLATVYSTLELLKDLGEIQELSIRKRGKACFDSDPNIHHHLLCRECGDIVGIKIDHPRNCPLFTQELINGCKIEEMQAYLYGVCSECLKKEDVKRT